MNDEGRLIAEVSRDDATLALRALSDADEGYELLYNKAVFRSTYDRVVSQAFADTILGLIKSGRGVDILLGGLGLGHTLDTVLKHPGLRSVTVVEPDEAIPEWARTHLGMGSALDDERTHLVVSGFPQFVDASPASYHGVGVEIDLGPTRVLREANRRSYAMSTLRSLASRLRSDGVFVVRVAEEDRAYRRALEDTFSEVGVRAVDETNQIGNSVRGVFYVARM